MENLKQLDFANVLKISMKYIIEGLAMVLVAYYIPTLYKTSLRKPSYQEVFTLAFIAALSMMMLDYFSDKSALGARLGAGFNIGRNLVSIV